MTAMTTVKCQNKKCGAEFQARTADVARGWGKFCSKSCKAQKQYNDTGVSRADYAATGRSVKEMKGGKYNKSGSGYRKGDHDTGHRGKCAFCGKNAVNAYRTNFDDGDLATWSSRMRCHVVRYCHDHEFEAEMAVSQDGEF